MCATLPLRTAAKPLSSGACPGLRSHLKEVAFGCVRMAKNLYQKGPSHIFVWHTLNIYSIFQNTLSSSHFLLPKRSQQGHIWQKSTVARYVGQFFDEKRQLHLYLYWSLVPVTSLLWRIESQKSGAGAGLSPRYLHEAPFLESSFHDWLLFGFRKPQKEKHQIMTQVRGFTY